tara:strand:+ start:6099 stop:6485 length:387 start_codon:yes stop_codon:yes gene_type:complete
MKIRYKRRYLRWNLVFGIFWLILGVIAIPNNSENFLNYGYLIAALLYIVNYLLKSKNQHLTIENERIILHNLIPKKIYKSDLIHIKKSAGVIILQTDKSELRIKTHLIDKNSLKDLNKILKHLNAKNA